MPNARVPIVIALVDDYEVVLLGVKHMFDSYRDRVTVAEVAAGDDIDEPVDIALCDTFAQPEADLNSFERALGNPLVAKTVIYTWVLSPHVVKAGLEKGASGYLSKRLAAAQLVDALELVHAGEVVVSEQAGWQRRSSSQAWPGREEGLTERESEVVALITQGYSNEQIAAMTYLSLNSIKTHIRHAYRKMKVTSRSQAVLWGVSHGFVPPGHGARS